MNLNPIDRNFLIIAPAISGLVKYFSPGCSLSLGLYTSNIRGNYRTSGQLSNYQPRRKDEEIVYRDPEGKYSDIEATIDYWFWFRQRILKYGVNAEILTPQNLADEIKQEYQKIWEKLSAPRRVLNFSS